jgi:tetratricopeptide (TPR) repeat protein
MFLRKAFFFFLIFSIPSRLLHGQSQDSLEIILKLRIHDSSKVKMINRDIFKVFLIDPASGLKQVNKALELSRRSGYKRGMALCYLNIGRAEYFLGNYERSLEYNFKALTEYEKLNDRIGIASAANSIGAIYYVQKDFTNAMGFYKKALGIQEELGDRKTSAALLCNIGSIFYDMMKFDEALKYYYTALDKLKNDTSQHYSLSTVYSCLGNAFWEKKDFNKALDFHKKAYKQQIKIGDKNGVANTLTNFGGIFNDLGLADSSIKYLEKAIDLARITNNKRALVTSHAFLGTALELKGDYRSAVYFHKRHYALKDSLFNSESAVRMSEVFSKYEAEKKDRERDLIEKAREAEQNAKLEKQRLLTIGISVVAFLILVFSILIYRSFKQKQKANIIIHQQKELAEAQKKQIEEKQKEILDSIYYAKRIQNAHLPKEDYIYRKINDLTKTKNGSSLK